MVFFKRKIGVLLFSLTLICSCTVDEISDTGVQGEAGPRSAKQNQPEKVSSTEEQPEYDDNGIPVPSRRQALGLAIPKGFERMRQGKGVVVYGGPIAPDKVLRFYHKYLEPARIIEMRKGWKFVEASPRAPGDTSRNINLVITKRGRKQTSIVVIDHTGQKNIKPPQNAKTYEELYKAAHSGTGSVREPIPGTY